MKKLTSIIFLYSFLNACSISDYTSDFSVTDILPFEAYKADIYQGAELHRLTINQLKIGMSKQDAYDIIGPPSIVDPFHDNQWDYVNYSHSNSKKAIHYRLILTFKDDKLSDINTDGLSTLAKMSAKDEKKLVAIIAHKKAEKKRLAEEKVKKVRLAKIAKEKARIAKIAKQKAEKLAKQKALKDAAIVKEKAAK
ncbi:MAG: outer membrane protein assembly factor BamE [Candidatus Thioglobus sp.]|nr:MAG: outer membrane protein assembly factor BamE [Candidatus Thioglobus sp.]